MLTNSLHLLNMQRAFRQRQKEKSQAMGRELKEVLPPHQALCLELPFVAVRHETGSPTISKGCAMRRRSRRSYRQSHLSENCCSSVTSSLRWHFLMQKPPRSASRRRSSSWFPLWECSPLANTMGTLQPHDPVPSLLRCACLKYFCKAQALLSCPKTSCSCKLGIFITLCHLLQAQASPDNSGEAEEVTLTNGNPLTSLATRLNVPQLEPAPGTHMWDSGEFILCTGSNRRYTFNDDSVRKMTLDEIVHIWEARSCLALQACVSCCSISTA